MYLLYKFSEIRTKNKKIKLSNIKLIKNFKGDLTHK